MKRQNGVVLSGRLSEPRVVRIDWEDQSGVYALATLITDHQAYGGHHCVLFPDMFARDVMAYWQLTGGHLEVTVEGWLRSMARHDDLPAAVVIVDRVIYLTVTDAMRAQVARRKALRTADRGQG